MDHNSSYISQVRKYFTENGTLIKAPRDTYLIKPGDPRSNLYFITSGFMRIFQVNDRNEEFTHILYSVGEVLPLSWLTKQATASAYYRTMTDMELYAVPADTVQKAMLSNAAFGYGMFQQTLEQYRIFTMRVNNLEYKYARERLAYRLLFLANRFGIPTADGVVIEPPLTHVVLASSLNLSRESVSREIEKFIRKGHLSYNNKRQIVLHDMAELARQEQVPLTQGLPSGVESFKAAHISRL